MISEASHILFGIVASTQMQTCILKKHGGFSWKLAVPLQMLLLRVRERYCLFMRLVETAKKEKQYLKNT